MSTADFVEENLLGLLPEYHGTSVGSDYLLSSVQNEEMGSATIEFTVKGLPEIFGKLYTGNKGSYSHELLRQLWDNGFGGGQPYRVPEPLTFMSQHNLLLMRKARGVTLSSYLENDTDAAVIGVREAARWLAKLHNALINTGWVDEVWDTFRKLSIESSEAAALHPEDSKSLKLMTTSLERLAPTFGAETVLVHGNFQPAHIFLREEAVTVVSLDGAAMSDSAKDLAQFIYRLRSTLQALGKTREADILTRAFLEEYWLLRPSGLENLTFYLPLKIFASLCNRMKSLRPANPELTRTISNHIAEFELAASGEFSPQQAATRTGAARERYQLSPEKRKEWKKIARSNLSHVTSDEFVRRVLYPLAYRRSAESTGPPRCEAEVIRDIGTGRVTLRYLFEDGTSIYGKLYSDPLVAQHGFHVHTKLWEEGFGENSPYRVPEPLAYLPEHRLLLQRAAVGLPLEDFIDGDSDELATYCRNAAKWLVRLHKSPLRIGPPESLWQSAKLFKVLRKIDKASAHVPAERERMLALVDRLCEIGGQMKGETPIVQTHGRFHHDHIFVNGEDVSVIDFDGSVPSDPAKDLAELLRLLRSHTFKQTGSTLKAELPEKVFLDEYLSHLPENGLNLAMIWGVTTLISISKKIKKFGKKKIDREEFERMIEFYSRELDMILSRAAS